MPPSRKTSSSGFRFVDQRVISCRWVFRGLGGTWSQPLRRARPASRTARRQCSGRAAAASSPAPGTRPPCEGSGRCSRSACPARRPRGAPWATIHQPRGPQLGTRASSQQDAVHVEHHWGRLSKCLASPAQPRRPFLGYRRSIPLIRGRHTFWTTASLECSTYTRVGACRHP